jgi:hypothetical protein
LSNVDANLRQTTFNNFTPPKQKSLFLGVRFLRFFHKYLYTTPKVLAQGIYGQSLNFELVDRPIFTDDLRRFEIQNFDIFCPKSPHFLQFFAARVSDTQLFLFDRKLFGKRFLWGKLEVLAGQSADSGRYQTVSLKVPPFRDFGQNRRGRVSLAKFFIKDFLNKKIFQRFAPDQKGGTFSETV